MRKIVWLLVLFMISTTGCGLANEEATEDLQLVSLKDIDILHIDYGSINLNLESADIDSLEVSLHLYDNGPGIIMEKGKQKISIRPKSDVTRLLKIGRMPELQVSIPSDYTGKVMIEGSSGNVTAKGLQIHNLEISGRSGNISLDFAEFHSDLLVSTSSGNITISLNQDNPDASWLLQSGSGRRSIAFPLKNHKQSNRKTEGRTGNGTYEVRLKTSSGNISIQ